MTKEKIAVFVSQLTEPMVVFMGLALVAGIRSGLSNSGLLAYFLYILFLMWVVWRVRVRFMKTHETNWDVSEQGKRVRLLLLLVPFSLFLVLSLSMWRSDEITRSSQLFLIWILGFFLMTLRIKISGHVGGFMLAIGHIIVWFGPWAWWLMTLLPVVAWSRLTLKRHTLQESVLGALYSVFIILVFLSV